MELTISEPTDKFQHQKEIQKKKKREIQADILYLLMEVLNTMRYRFKGRIKRTQQVIGDWIIKCYPNRTNPKIVNRLLML